MPCREMFSQFDGTVQSNCMHGQGVDIPDKNDKSKIARQPAYAHRSTRSFKLTERQLPPTYSSAQFGALDPLLDLRFITCGDGRFRFQNI